MFDTPLGNDDKYVFISYSTLNQGAADAMHRLLKEEGIRTWMAPGDIPAGSKYAAVINKAIRDCACFVLMLSDEAQNSVWVAKETERAVNYRKPIFPVRLENVVLNDEFELYISTDQVIALNRLERDSIEMQKLFASLRIYTECAKKKTFVLIDAENDQKRYALKNGSYLIGKDERKCDVLVEDNFVSKIHASLTVSENGVLLKDLNTANGTYINGEKIVPNTEVCMKAGDSVGIGKQELLLVEEE